MIGENLGKDYYDSIQKLYSRMSINSSLNTFVENGFKTRDEIKTINEKTGSFVCRIIKWAKDLFF